MECVAESGFFVLRKVRACVVEYAVELGVSDGEACELILVVVEALVDSVDCGLVLGLGDVFSEYARGELSLEE